MAVAQRHEKEEKEFLAYQNDENMCMKPTSKNLLKEYIQRPHILPCFFFLAYDRPSLGLLCLYRDSNELKDKPNISESPVIDLLCHATGEIQNHTYMA